LQWKPPTENARLEKCQAEVRLTKIPPAIIHPQSSILVSFAPSRLGVKSRKSMLIIANRVPIPGFPKVFENSLKDFVASSVLDGVREFFPLNPFLKNQLPQIQDWPERAWRLNGRRSRWPGTASHRLGSCSVIFNDSSMVVNKHVAGLI
jgi:hypothetical protein